MQRSDGSGSGSGSGNVFLGTCRSVNDFEKLGGRIGEGTYGTVYRARDRTSGKVVALKKIILHNEEKDGFPLTSIRELSALRKCQGHAGIVKFIEVAVGKARDGTFIVFEYCEHDLSTLLSRVRRPFSESEIKCLMLQLLSAVNHMHKLWIIHRDIKLSNLLYTNQGELRVADFGLARTFSHVGAERVMTQKVVTLWYRAPELLLGSHIYSTAIDIWSVGCVMGELLGDEPLLPGDGEMNQIERTFDLLGGPSCAIWPKVVDMPLVQSGAIDLRRQQERHPYNNLSNRLPKLDSEGLHLLTSLLAYDPEKRLTARNASRHDYFYMRPFPKEQELMPTFPTAHANPCGTSSSASSSSASSQQQQQQQQQQHATKKRPRSDD